MKLLAVEYGIHTIELYASAVPYEQSQQIIEALLARNAFYKMRETEQLYEDRYGVDRTYRSDIFSSSGIRFYRSLSPSAEFVLSSTHLPCALEHIVVSLCTSQRTVLMFWTVSSGSFVGGCFLSIWRISSTWILKSSRSVESTSPSIFTFQRAQT